MFPVTGVVPILKQLIQDHYGVGDLTTSLFMSINMVGALIAAPILGWVSDRYGVPRLILIVCALIDAALWWTFTLRPPFPLLMALRLLEGAAHIGALSMLMAVMSQASDGAGRRARMAGLGGAVIFGVAIGAPLGGVLGQRDVLLPLQIGVVLMVLVAAVAVAAIPERVIAPSPEALPRWPRLYAPPALRLPYLFGFVDRLTIGVFIITFALLTATLGFGPQKTGMAIGVFMMTFTALSYPAGKLAERIGTWRMVFTGSIGFGFAYAAVPWLTGSLLWADMVLCGLFSAVMFGPNLMLVVRNSTQETRSSAMAGFNAAGSLGFLIGPLLGGGLLELFKSMTGDEAAFRATFASVGFIEVICVGYAIWALRSGQAGAGRSELSGS
jgi:MFS transporter, AAHS family, 3-hydroxyphenylpropionic acid transporter